MKRSSLRNESGAALLTVLVIAVIGAIVGLAAVKSTTRTVKVAGHSRARVNLLNIAEAGKEHALAKLRSGEVTPSEGASEEIVPLADFGGGQYRVDYTANGDASRLWLISTATYQDMSRAIEVTVEVTPCVPTNPLDAVFKGAIMSRGPAFANGGLVVDGRKYELDGTLVPNSGLAAVSSRSTWGISGSATCAGTDNTGTDRGPAASGSGYDAVVKTGATDWEWTSPDDVLGLAEGTLKSIAVSGVAGSQYATDPKNQLSWPLSGVTYVELTGNAKFQAIDFSNSSGILVVHNSSFDAVLKNPNNGTFNGLLIADDIVHWHCDLNGVLVSLSTTPSSGNVIGNGDGVVKYCPEAIELALNSVSIPVPGGGGGGGGGCTCATYTVSEWKEL